jgi:hypothetical protein
MRRGSDNKPMCAYLIKLETNNTCIFNHKRTYKTNFFTPFMKLNSMSDIMVSVLASSVVDRGFKPRSGQNQKLSNWYVLLLRLAHNIKKKEQRLAGSESG